MNKFIIPLSIVASIAVLYITTIYIRTFIDNQIDSAIRTHIQMNQLESTSIQSSPVGNDQQPLTNEVILMKIKYLEASVLRSIQHVNELACARGDKVVTLSGGYCINPNNVITGGNERFDGTMCAGIEEMIGNSSVGDFGAGLGHYGRCLLRINNNIIQTNNNKEHELLQTTFISQMKDAGIYNKQQVIKSWNGYDGAGNIQTLSNGIIQYLDLTMKVDLGKRFDWVMSLEVGEHIAKQYQHTYIQNLLTHACKGIIITWAIPGQNGHHHINNRPHSDVIKDFQTLGMIHDVEREQQLNNRATFAYFKRTLVFKFPHARCS